MDLQLTDGPVHFLLDCSAYSGGGSVIVTFKESSDDSTYTTFLTGDANQVASVTLTTTALAIYTNPLRTKRYVRAYITVTSSPTATLSVLVVAAKKKLGAAGTVTNSAPGGSY